MKTLAALTIAALAGYTARSFQDLPQTAPATPPPFTAEELIGAGIKALCEVPEIDDSDISEIIANVRANVREGIQP